MTFISCDSSDVNDGNDPLIGKWHHTKRAFSAGADPIIEDIEDGGIYGIREDGTFTYLFDGRSSGTWDISSDDILNFNFDEEVEDRVVNFNYEIVGSELTLACFCIL